MIPPPCHMTSPQRQAAACCHSAPEDLREFNAFITGGAGSDEAEITEALSAEPRCSCRAFPRPPLPQRQIRIERVAAAGRRCRASAFKLPQLRPSWTSAKRRQSAHGSSLLRLSSSLTRCAPCLWIVIGSVPKCATPEVGSAEQVWPGCLPPLPSPGHSCRQNDPGGTAATQP